MGAVWDLISMQPVMSVFGACDPWLLGQIPPWLLMSGSLPLLCASAVPWMGCLVLWMCTQGLKSHFLLWACPEFSSVGLWGFVFYRLPLQHLLELFCILNLSCVGVNYIIKLSAVNFLHPCGGHNFLQTQGQCSCPGFCFVLCTSVGTCEFSWSQGSPRILLRLS